MGSIGGISGSGGMQPLQPSNPPYQTLLANYLDDPSQANDDALVKDLAKLAPHFSQLHSLEAVVSQMGDYSSNYAVLANQIKSLKSELSSAEKAGNDPAKIEQLKNRISSLQTQQIGLKDDYKVMLNDSITSLLMK